MSKIEIINGKLMMHERDLKQISLDFIEKNLCLIFLKNSSIGHNFKLQTLMLKPDCEDGRIILLWYCLAGYMGILLLKEK